jgi:Ser/Thr protein kinase RdoA (MazF antagonist)
VTPDGVVAGALPAIPLATPWWQEIGSLVAAVRERRGLEITVLRLLEAGLPKPPGGEVTYLAEVDEAPADLEPWGGALDHQALRLPYARPSGPAADLAWAQARLAERGVALAGRPEQVRTWNLSSLWRIPCDRGAVWLKVVPPFFAHEGAVLTHLAGRPVPTLLAHDGPRSLLAELEGEDLYEATLAQRTAMINLLVPLQAEQAASVDDLLALRLPDWRAGPLIEAISSVADRAAPELNFEDRAALAPFLRGLAARLARIADCGLPDTLVHGDFHSGNFRGYGDELTLLDWGDSGVGNPLLDQPAFLDRAPPAQSPALREHWRDRWRELAPGSDPARAAELIAPVAAARQAVIYQGFLDRIEPSEHPYHRTDPADWLARTAALLREEGRGLDEPGVS